MSVRARASALGAATLLALGTVSALSAPAAHAATRTVTGSVVIGGSPQVPATGAVVTASSRSGTFASVTGPVASDGSYALDLDDATSWTLCFNEPSSAAVHRFLPGQCAQGAVSPSLTSTAPSMVLSPAGVLHGSVSAPVGVTITTARLVTQHDGVWAEAGSGDDWVDPEGSVANGGFDIVDVPTDESYRLCFDAINNATGLSGPAGCDGGDEPENASPVVVQGGSNTRPAVTLSTSLVSVHGVIRDASQQPVADAVVTLERQVGNAWERDYRFDPTDSSGGYDLLVLPGSYRVRVTPAPSTGGARSLSTAYPVSGATTLPTQSLAAAGTVHGIVVPPPGEDPSGIEVQALDGQNVELARALTESDGSYTLTNVPSAVAVTLVVAGGYDPTTDLQQTVVSPVVVGNAQPVTVARGATVTGTVVDADVPSVNAEVTAFDPNGAYPSRSAYVTTAGQFSVGGLTPGVSYDVSVDPHDGRQVRYLRDPAADVQTSSTGLHAFAAGTTLGIVDLSGLNGTVPAPATIAISGSPVVGATLQAQVTGWSPTAQPEQVLYTWYAGSTPVTATGTGSLVDPYTVRAADVGKTISLQVIGRLSGFRSVRTQPGAGTAFAPSPPAPPPAAPTPTPTITVSRAPALRGTAKVGKVLTVSPGAASPSASVSLQWLRNGAPIPGATRTSYKLGKADKGKRISVRTSYTRSGYHSASRTTSATRPVAR